MKTTTKKLQILQMGPHLLLPRSLNINTITNTTKRPNKHKHIQGHHQTKMRAVEQDKAKPNSIMMSFKPMQIKLVLRLMSIRFKIKATRTKTNLLANLLQSQPKSLM
jgi:hypothetical protein